MNQPDVTKSVAPTAQVSTSEGNTSEQSKRHECRYRFQIDPSGPFDVASEDPVNRDEPWGSSPEKASGLEPEAYDATPLGS